MSVHGRRDFLLLQMVNGALIFSVDNGRGPIVATYISPEEHHLCDGKWHYIQGMIALEMYIKLNLTQFFFHY